MRFCCLLALLAVAGFARAAERFTCEWEPDAMPAKMLLNWDGKAVLQAEGKAWHTPTDCAVVIRPEARRHGIQLHVTVTNPTDAPAALPTFHIPGIQLPRVGPRRLDNWKIVSWTGPTAADHRVHLHTLRTYPGQCYAPVLGLKTRDLAIGAAVLYDVFGLQWEWYGNYAFDDRSNSWTFEFMPSTAQVITPEGRGRQLEPISLEPGATAEFAFSLAVADPGDWLSTFTDYRDRFREQFGMRRQQRSAEPVFAYSLSSGPAKENQTDENPRSFAPLPIHQTGWKGFPELIEELAVDRNFKRLMLWGSVGRYRANPQHNMAWEIGSAWLPIQQETEAEFTRLSKELDLTVGLWMGRFFSVTGGFDSGDRHPWDPDNPADQEAIFRELRIARDRGVRLIGCDAVRSAYSAAHWAPGAIPAWRHLWPRLHAEFPELRWIVEPAASDFMHLWGSSFIWEKQATGPFAFADFLAPGAETNATLKQSEPRISSMHLDWQKRFEEMIFWGYTPIVFGDRQGKLVTVPRWQDPKDWPESIVGRVGDLDVRFDGSKKWTLHRIDFEGQRLCIDVPGSSYGTVAKVADLGFVGSGHTETGREEEVLGLRLYVNGEEVTGIPEARYDAERIELVKESRLHNLRMIDRWIVADGAIEEEVWLRAVAPIKLDLLYVGMYPWSNTMTDFLALTTLDERLDESFAGENQFRVAQPVRWVALYDRKARRGALTEILEVSGDVSWRTRIWDRESPYKKHYLDCLRGRHLGPGDTFGFRLRIRPFASEVAEWRQHAQRLAE